MIVAELRVETIEGKINIVCKLVDDVTSTEAERTLMASRVFTISDTVYDKDGEILKLLKRR